MTRHKSNWLGRASIKAEAPLQVILILVMILGAFGALFLGSAVAQSKTSVLTLVAGGALAMGICLSLRTNIWMLIPLAWCLTGKPLGGRIPLAVSEVAIVAAFGMYVIFLAMKRIPKLGRPNICDAFLYINILWIAVMWIRNPAGVGFIASDIVGGRPYITIAIVMLGYWVLQHVTLKKTQVALIPVLVAFGAALSGGLGMLTNFIPALVPIIHPIYSGIDIGAYMNESRATYDAGASTNRLISLQNYAVAGTTAIVSFFRPLPLLLGLRPLWSLICYSTLAAALFSGFRTVLIFWFVAVLLSSYFRGGLSDVIRIGIVGFLGVFLVVSLQLGGFNVPRQIQRSLSFIPIAWDPVVVSDANASSEWRFTMWREALTGNRYIKNKLLGDGYGFDARELKAFQAISGVGALTTSEQVQDYFLIVGAYHSGPISAIRYGGAVGLFFLTALLIACANYGWKLIRSAIGTPFLPIALFAGIPAIYRPVEYWALAGAFDSSYPHIIFTLALLNITSRSLSAWEEQRRSKIATPLEIAHHAEEPSLG